MTAWIMSSYLGKGIYEESEVTLSITNGHELISRWGKMRLTAGPFSHRHLALWSNFQKWEVSTTDRNDVPPHQALSLTQGSVAIIKKTHPNGSQTHLLELPYSPDFGQR